MSPKANACPMTVRLAWHAAGTFDAADSSGGSNGATMRFEPEASDGANAGLSIMRDILKRVKDNHPDLSTADLWALAGSAAVEFMGGPRVDVRFGRGDASDGGACPANGRLPDAAQGAAHLRDVFGRMGFNDQEIVALSGAHTLGRCHVERSGFDGPWTRNPLRFDNVYFKNLLNLEWVEHTTSAGNRQYVDSKTRELMMLPTDYALVQDPVFKKQVEVYARDQNRFFRDFGKAFSKLLALGVPAAADPAQDDGEDRRSTKARATEAFLQYSMHGSEDFVRKYAPDADVHGVERGSRRTALHKASYWGHINIVRYLVSDLGLRIDAQDYNGDTALHDAARFGHAPVVAALLEAGASTSIRNAEGQDALAVAAEYQKRDCAQLIAKASKASKL